MNKEAGDPLAGERDACAAALRIGMKPDSELRAMIDDIVSVDNSLSRVKTEGSKRKFSSFAVLQDRFTICHRHASMRGKDQVRELHPSFRAFNEWSLYREPITQVRARLMFATVAENFQYERRATKLGGRFPIHPSKIAACYTKPGEWERAYRLFKVNGEGREPIEGMHRVPDKPEDEEWYEVSCLGRQCQFAERCSIKCRLVFMPIWPNEEPFAELPHTPMLLASSYYTGDEIKSLFGRWADMAAGVGREIKTHSGLVFVLNLTARSNPKKGTVIPVVTASPEGAPADILAAQRIEIEQAGGGEPLQLVASLSDPPESNRETIEADVAAISGDIPAQRGLLDDQA